MKKRIISLALAGIIAASGAMAVSAEDTRAAGVAFKAETGYLASTYTGYASGIPCGKSESISVNEVLSALENSNGVEIRRAGTKLGDDEKVLVGDKIVLMGDDGAVKSEFTLMMMGDTNDNGGLNLSDASGMLKKIAKWDVTINDMASDVNGDGAVNLSDVSVILKSIAKWDVEFVKYPVLPGKYKMELVGALAANSATTSDGWEGINLNSNAAADGANSEIGVKFAINEGNYATEITALCPSWGDDKGSVTFSVYKWTGDYASTVAAMPICTETYKDFTDNSLINMSLLDTSGKGLVAGEYLWRIHDCIDTEGAGNGVGLWCYRDKAPAEDTGMKAFLDCEESNIGPVVVISVSAAK